MKAIVTINTSMPSVDGHIDYLSTESLRDYDIAIFDPGLPYMDRIDFSGGGSCLSIESTVSIRAAMKHWSEEIRSALSKGKTIFVLMSELVTDQGADSYSSKTKGSRTYNTSYISNYGALPITPPIKNTTGKRIKVVDQGYGHLLTALGDLVRYKAIFNASFGHTIFATKDDAPVGAVTQLEGSSGHLVFLPYFDLADFDRDSGDTWSTAAVRISKAIVSQIIAIDKMLITKGEETPAPEWLSGIEVPAAVARIESAIAEIDVKLDALTKRKVKQLAEKKAVMSFARLLYDNGKNLEAAIEDALRLLGFTVENFRSGDLEIDHIIIGPSGKRLIGESEGKDTSAVDISKFRQLESNIQEDFQRDDVNEPAKGVLFANGFRLTEPHTRPEQFTAKCLTNAKRLGTSLVRTADLYTVVLHLLNQPEDEAFKHACRNAIENTEGSVVAFPKPT